MLEFLKKLWRNKLHDFLSTILYQMKFVTLCQVKLQENMSAKVYIVIDRTAIDFIENNDIDGFSNYLAEEEDLMFDAPVEFETEQEALAFCAGLGYGTIEGAPIELFPLRSFEEYDQPFIELIENY